MWRWLLALLIVVPMAELALLIEVGRWIGTGPTIALVIGTGALGALLVRQQGWLVLEEIRREARAGKVPSVGLLHSVLVLIGGVLLLTPGLMTDTVGFLLLLPTTRRFCVRWLRERFREWIAEGVVFIERWP